MMKKLYLLILYLVSLPVAAGVSVEVVETFPQDTDLALAIDQNFYVRVKYSSDLPVRIYVRPYTGGKPADAISGIAVSLPPGAGETLGWFAMRQPGLIDEFRISADTQNTGYPTDLLAVPVRLEWKPGGAMTNTGQPEWISRINRINDALWAAERRNAQMTGAGSETVLGILIVSLLFAIPMIAIALCVAGAVRWPGGWRYFAMAPLALVAIWTVKLMIDVSRDPTSHNLWPFELLYWAAGTLAWLGVLCVVKKLGAKLGTGDALS